MKDYILRILFILMLPLLLCSCTQPGDAVSKKEEDIIAIKSAITDYDSGWDTKNIEKVLSSYSEDIDWTNTFGDRVQGKTELRNLLEVIFGLDFVMSGQNNYEDPDISFLSKKIALARSINIRNGQKWPDGSPMKDRVINHLRVFEYKNGKWLCVNHMISQAHDKRGK